MTIASNGCTNRCWPTTEKSTGKVTAGYRRVNLAELVSSESEEQEEDEKTGEDEKTAEDIRRWMDKEINDVKLEEEAIVKQQLSYFPTKQDIASLVLNAINKLAY